MTTTPIDDFAAAPLTRSNSGRIAQRLFAPARPILGEWLSRPSAVAAVVVAILLAAVTATLKM
jgi:hypothetical protein